jgi:hypothetical protein
MKQVQELTGLLLDSLVILCVRDAYEELKNKYKVVFQTPVRKNTNSDNDFIFCVFDTKRSKKSVREEHNNQYIWPFKE